MKVEKKAIAFVRGLQEELINSNYSGFYILPELLGVAHHSFMVGYNEAIRWRDPKDELPELLPGCDYSNNVLAQVEGFTETQVMCLSFIPDDEGEWGYAWANCYGNINGEAEWDDNYKVIGWRPIE